MRIKTLNELLKTKNPNASATIVTKQDKRTNKINVTFGTGSKTYSYSGTILSVAEKLDLIPEVNIKAESKIAADDIATYGAATIHVETVDTLTHTMQKNIKITSYDKDVFGRKVVTVKIDNTPNPWI